MTVSSGQTFYLRELNLAPIPQGKTAEATGYPVQVTVEVWSILSPSTGTGMSSTPDFTTSTVVTTAAR